MATRTPAPRRGNHQEPIQLQEHFKLLQKINELINLGRPLSDILQLFVEGVREVSEYKSVAFFLLEDDKQHITMSNVSIDTSNIGKVEKIVGFQIPGMRLPLFEGSNFKKIIDTKQGDVIKDIRTVLADYALSSKLIKSIDRVATIIGEQITYRIPLVSGDEILGILTASRGVEQQNGDLERDLAELEYLASDAIIAINKAKIDEELRLSEKKYRDIIELAPDAIVTQNLDGVITSINPAMSHISGYSQDEIVGLHITDAPFFLSEDMESFRKTLAAIEDEEYTSPFEINWFHRDGSKRVAEVHVSKMRDGESVTGYQSIIRDITRRKTSERKMLLQQEALERQNTLLQEKNIALREVMNQLEVEKERIESQIRENVNQLLIPAIDKLKARSGTFESDYLDMIKDGLHDLISPFAQKLSSSTYRLTAREIEVCNLIKGGFSSKEIGKHLNISHRTVETLRYRIRKKLDILNQQVNLQTYLQSL